ncbi:hypothetical protein DFJ73DRAFT_551277 [Zopfochytrium polystomum]|nr:hypothetical protein DFJ73DRAFT_551277 [Zopfochytrium polystomum]
MIRAKRPVSQPPSFTPRTGARSSLSNARDAGRASSLPKPLPGAKGDQRPSLPRGHPQTTAASAVSAMTAAAGAAAASAATPLIGASAATRSDASRNRRRTYLERLVTELLSRLNALRVTTRSSRVIGFSVRAAVAAVLVSLTAYCSYRLLFVLLWRRPSNKQIPDAEGANSEFKHRSSADADHSPRATPQLKVESSQSTVTEGAHLTSSLSTSTKPSLAIASSGPSSSIPRHVKGLLLTVSVKNVGI